MNIDGSRMSGCRRFLMTYASSLRLLLTQTKQRHVSEHQNYLWTRMKNWVGLALVSSFMSNNDKRYVPVGWKETMANPPGKTVYQMEEDLVGDSEYDWSSVKVRSTVSIGMVLVARQWSNVRTHNIKISHIPFDPFVTLLVHYWTFWLLYHSAHTELIPTKLVVPFHSIFHKNRKKNERSKLVVSRWRPTTITPTHRKRNGQSSSENQHPKQKSSLNKKATRS